MKFITWNWSVLTQRYERAAEKYLEFAQTLEKVSPVYKDISDDKYVLINYVSGRLSLQYKT